MSSSRALVFARSLFLQAGFGDERRQALGFAWALDPVLSEAYANDSRGLAEARTRHFGSFNTNPYAAGLILGVTASLERRIAAGEESLRGRVSVLKSSAGASLAGAADAFFWGALRPLAAASAVLIATTLFILRQPHPFFWGSVVGLAIFNIPALVARWKGLSRGLAEGEGALAAAALLPVQKWIYLTRVAAGGVMIAAAALASSSGVIVHPLWSAGAFLAGVVFSAHAGGPLKLVAGAGLVGAAAAAGGWRL